MKNRTTVERKSERELVITRTVNGPACIVFETWTKPELFKRWWIPKSAGVFLLSCEMDVRVGGRYRLVFSFKGSEMAFFGTYREVTPHSRLVWTNDEAGDAGQITTVTFEEKAGKTLVVMHELYPSKEALDAALASGSQDGTLETFEQLDQLLVTLSASVGRLLSRRSRGACRRCLSIAFGEAGWRHPEGRFSIEPYAAAAQVGQVARWSAIIHEASRVMSMTCDPYHIAFSTCDSILCARRIALEGPRP